MQDRFVLNLLKSFISTNKTLFIFAIFSTITTSIIVLSFGYIIRQMIDGISHGQTKIINLSILKLFLATLTLCIFSFCRSFFMNFIAENFCQNQKLLLYRQILNATIPSTQEIGTEKIISSLSSSFNQIRTILGTSFPFLIRSSFTLIGSFAIIFYISTYLTFWVILSIFTLMIPAFFLGKKLKKQSKMIKINLQDSDKRIFDSIINLKVVKSFCNEDMEYNAYNEYLNNSMKQEKIRLILRSLFISLCIFAVVSSVLIAVYFGIEKISSNQLSSGQLTAFMLYAVMIAMGLGGVSEHGSEFMQIKNAWKKILDVSNNLKFQEGEIRNENFHISNIAVKQFDFQWNGQENEIIHIPKFTIQTGQIGLFHTKSGSGKSSFFDMIMKYVAIDRGNIIISNNDINDIHYKDLRKNISYCMQNSIILEKTLLENLQYSGCKDINLIKNTMKDLEIPYLIPKLNEYVNNFTLSGGEKTRISIALSILNKNANLMIFDEPTNGLDVVNAEKIINLILKQTFNKITFISSHDENVKAILADKNVLNINITK